jgi:hypothetical protein
MLGQKMKAHVVEFIKQTEGHYVQQNESSFMVKQDSL